MCREPGARGAVVVAAVDCTHSLLYNIARCNIQKAVIILTVYAPYQYNCI